MARLLKIYALLLLGLVLAELAARPAGAQLLRPRPLQPQSGNALASTSRPIDSIPSVSSEENTAESVSAVVGSSSRRLSADGKSGADAGSNSSGSAGSGIGAKANAQASVTATQQPSAPGAEVGAPSKGPGSAAGAVLAGGAGCSAPGPGAPPPCASPKPSPQPSPSPSPPRGPPFPNDNPDAILGPYDTLNVVTRPKKKPGLVERVAFGRGTVDQLDDCERTRRRPCLLCCVWDDRACTPAARAPQQKASLAAQAAAPTSCALRCRHLQHLRRPAGGGGGRSIRHGGRGRGKLAVG